MTTTAIRPGERAVAPDPKSAEDSGLARIAGWCHDHRWWVLILWLVVLVGSNVLAHSVGSNFSNNLTGGAQPVQQILNKAFPDQKGSPAQVVLTSTGPISGTAVKERTARLTAALEPLAHVSEVVSPFSAAGAHQVSTDGHIAYIQLQFDEQAGDLPQSAIDKVISTAQSFGTPDYHVALGGQAISLVAGGKPGSSEGIGILAAIIIMLLAFGSVVAMGLPIMTALFGIAIVFATLDLLSQVITTPTFAPEMMAMIGLGVGIDYAAVHRHPLQARTRRRSQPPPGHGGLARDLGPFGCLRRDDGHPVAARVVHPPAALHERSRCRRHRRGHAGHAGGLTLLPAMLGFSGRAVDNLHVPGLLQNASAPAARGFWYRWSRTVQRRPVLAGGAARADPGPTCPCSPCVWPSPTPATTRRARRPVRRTTTSAGVRPWLQRAAVVAASVPGGQPRRGGVAPIERLAATPGVASLRRRPSSSARVTTP